MKIQLSKSLSFFICLILVFITSVVFNKIFDYGKGLFYESKIEKNLDNKSQDSKYSFLYYDEDIKEETKEIYRECLNDVSFLVDDLKEKSTNIYVSNKKVLESLFELTGSKRFKVSNNVIALYINKLNLVIVDSSYDPIKTNLTINKNEVPENLVSLLEENDIRAVNNFYYLDLENIIANILSEDDVKSIKNIYSKKTLYHELGHFMDYNSSIRLSKDKNFKKIFKEEKNIIFGKEQSYYKDDIREYIAECVSFILNDGSIENGNNIGIKLNTGEYINHLINSFK